MESELLDSVIGVVFVWFLLSSVLSVVGEGFALVTHARAKHLWLGIGRLIDPVRMRLSARLLDTTFKVPFSGRLDVRPVASATPAAAAATAEPVLLSPSWWTQRPARNGEERTGGVRAKNQQLYSELLPHVVEIAKSQRLSKISHVAAESFADAVLALARRVHSSDLIDAAREAGWPEDRVDELTTALEPFAPGDPLEPETVTGLGGPDEFATTEELRELYQRASTLLTGRDVATYFSENPDLVRAVRRAAAAAGVDERTAAVKKVVESWFEREMNQLSGFYRRQSRKILGILAIPLVLFCHANTIEIFDTLRRDAALRQAVVNAAVADSARASVDKAILANCETPEGTTSTSTSATSTTTSTVADPVNEAADRFKCASTIIDRAGTFRVGLAWQDLKSAHGAQGDDARLQRADIWPYLGHALGDNWGLVGRLITLLAILFGAQFWFDVLRRLTGLRGVVSRVGNRTEE